MKFGLMFFASNEESLSGERYRLVLESARFADVHRFSSVWVPERHFTEFGSLYPNPAVLQAALATCTQRVKLRAGSVVAPLHNPLRIAEEWSMVDNLSGGRVGVSFAPGWNPDDFVLNPGAYARRQEDLYAAIGTVQRLWRGETLDTENGKGERKQTRVYPTPVQPELPLWLTAAGNPQTFTKAGEIGANLLTHILDQDEEQLAHKIALYRQARAENGFDPGQVTAMLHTFVGGDAALVREQARAPFCNYIRSNIGLLNGLAQSRGQQIDVRSMPAKQLDDFVNFLYERFAQSRGLIGTPESCEPLVRKLAAIGVDEVACLLDFGPPVELILENLSHLSRLEQLCRKENKKPAPRFDPLVVQARCTMADPEDSGSGGMEQVWLGTKETLAKLHFEEALLPNARAVILDTCPHVLARVASSAAPLSPSGFASLRIPKEPTTADLQSFVWCHAELHGNADAETIVGDVRVYDAMGLLLMQVEGLRLQAERRSTENAAALALDDLLYRRDWKLLEPGREIANPGTWLLIVDQEGVGERLAEKLEAHGGRCTVIAGDAPLDQQSFTDANFDGILYLRGLNLAPTDLPGRKEHSANVLQMVQALAKNNTGRLPRLWLATRSAMPVFAAEMPAVAQTALWGLGQAIAAEHPTLWGGLLDLDPAEADGGDVWRAIHTATREDGKREDLLALRGQQLYAQRLVRNEQASGASQMPRFDKEATYLVTGRLNGLGLHLAGWLRAHGAEHIALVGRSEPAPGSQHTRFFRCDLVDQDQTIATIDAIEDSMPPVKGVFHLAGVLDDSLLVNQNPERFYDSGIGKAEGAWNLHVATEGCELDHFVLYSTVAAMLTIPGQGSYAASNITLDALAHRRRAEGKAALCVNWGPWSEIGMTATQYGRAANERLAAAGITPLDPEVALNALGYLLQTGVTQSAVARIDWARLFAGAPQSATAPLLSEFVTADEGIAQIETELVGELRACAPPDRTELLTGVIAAMVAESLRLSGADAIGSTQSFFELGIDSILALELTTRLSTKLGRPFPGTLLFTTPTSRSLAEHLLEELLPALTSASSASSQESKFDVSTGESVGDELAEDEWTEEELSRLIEEEISSR